MIFKLLTPINGISALTKLFFAGKTQKIISNLLISVLIILTAQGMAAASGPFGTPEPISKAAGGLHTGIGYWHQENIYMAGAEYVTEQHQVYSQLGYGSQNRWEIYARVGISDLKVFDAFNSTTAAIRTDKLDFEENKNISSTLGAKYFYHLSAIYGIGAYMQATYYLRDFTDDVSGTRSGVPFSAEVRVTELWDVNFGLGFQATVPSNIRFYLGPYVTYSEAKVSSSPNIPGLDFTAGDTTFKNKNNIGAFAGVDVPLARGFRLNVEGQYAERLSGGAAVTYSY